VLADGGWAGACRRPFLQRLLPRFYFRGSLIYVKALERFSISLARVERQAI
jgi:hypothetical protein